MLKTLFTLLVISILSTQCHAQPSVPHFEPVAVVELFTSEGCSSCPPADKVLTKLTADAASDHRKIYTLSFHVDYWDRLGWRDPFSSSSYSDRQRQYAESMGLNGVYTPQMVVNGKYELVGSDETKLNEALSKSLQIKTTAALTKLTAAIRDQKIIVDYEAQGDLRGSDIHFALVSPYESTAVRRGENSGRQLSHTDVVLQFTSLPAAVQGSVSFDQPTATDAHNLIVIAYVQQSDGMHIIAAASTDL
jgi:hypothetical protein